MGGGDELPRVSSNQLQQALLSSPDPNIHLHAVVDLGR